MLRILKHMDRGDGVLIKVGSMRGRGSLGKKCSFSFGHIEFQNPRDIQVEMWYR